MCERRAPVNLPIPASPVSRRAALGVVTAGAVTGAVAACASPAGDSGAPSSPAPGTDAAPSPEESVATVDEVPVGGGVVLAGAAVVLTQPREGEFRAFSTTCTHEGCPVDEVADGEIVCPCHGSRFSIADGSRTDGPATEPLEEYPVSVTGEGGLVVG
ncbi:Ferredoxin subunit of nitrite reductase or a ring-hydroxylating dioxygenase [Nocardiopsis flavescens]|uniref:Cytochrome bc1 complex Rieske iron-sulfur subunit n=1 Tax=Nocardiopsis flavescens TaxID=758803 RepID=A0A1M6KN13_9ACTN|nr:Ferredoxin subunit of nitrite reductase or a ring-hydroxylating dioxygenase [Nocardiopsis flavescens]